MIPGVDANIIAFVMIILVLFGWGGKTLRDGRLSPSLISLLLLAFVLATDWTLRGPYGLRFDVGGALLPIGLAVWTLVSCRSLAMRIQWVLGTVTVMAAVMVLQILVPLDPAFFFLNTSYLVPAVAVLIALFSAKRPFFALSMAIGGLFFGSVSDLLLHDANHVHSVIFGNGELRDMLSFAAAGVLVTHGVYQTCLRFVRGLLRNWLGSRGQEGGPEQV